MTKFRELRQTYGFDEVAIVPGDPFGCSKNIRLSFACSMEQIEKGIDRIQKWLQ